MKQILEIGTGSGLITVELKRYFPHNFYLQVDINPCIPKGKGEYVICDLLSAIRQEKIDFCFFNPPYVPTKHIHTDYRSSYAGGHNGVEVINRFIDTVKVKEVLLLVIEVNKPNEVVERFKKRGYTEVEIVLKRKIMKEVVYLIWARAPKVCMNISACV